MQLRQAYEIGELLINASFQFLSLEHTMETRFKAIIPEEG